MVWLRAQVASMEARLARPLGAKARFGNETIRVTDTGRLSIKLPAPLAHLANAPNGRYVLDATVRFQHRGAEWRDRIIANRAVAYRIHQDTARGRWYVTASWQPATQARPDTGRREETRPHLPGPRTRRASPVVERKRGTSLPSTVRGSATEQQSWHQDSLPLSV